MHLFHIASAQEWEASKESGSYDMARPGRTLRQEGFVHCAREDQWRSAWSRLRTDEALVLLVIDQERLTSPVVEEQTVSGSGRAAYPHVYGPINGDSVVSVVPLEPADQPEAAGDAAAARPPVPPATASSPAPLASPPFVVLWVREMAFNTGMALVVVLLGCVGLLLTIGQPPAVQLTCVLGGLAIGLALAVLLYRRRERRNSQDHVERHTPDAVGRLEN